MSSSLLALKRQAWMELGLVLLTARRALHRRGGHLLERIPPVPRALSRAGPRLGGCGATPWLRLSPPMGCCRRSVGSGWLPTGSRAAAAVHPPSSLYFLLALYPVWGLVQQLIICALVGKNLEAIFRSRAWATAVGAILFGAVHLLNALKI